MIEERKGYIDRDKLMNELFYSTVVMGNGDFLEIIRNQPNADVEHVVHAKNNSGLGDDCFQCSHCGLTIDGELYEIIITDDFDFDKKHFRVVFCPNCGAKIDLEE